MDNFFSNEPNSENWDEFDWEKMMRKGDKFANKYFKLLKRFGQLPHGDDVILNKLGGLAPALLAEDDIFMELSLEEDFSEGDFNDEDFEIVEDLVYFEKHPAFTLLRHVAIGWCNIFSTYLSAEHRLQGVHILFHLGRGLAHLAGAIGDGIYDEPAGFIASTKRALVQVNEAIGKIEQLSEASKNYSKITDKLNEHLRDVTSKAKDHLFMLRDIEKEAK